MSHVRSVLGIVSLSLLASSPIYAGKPISNAVKYKDAGAKPATGRSGSAAIQVRALRGQGGTDVEVTTGQFDSDAPSAGKLDKVQVKLFATNGELIVTDNYRKGTLSGGYGSFAYSWPARGQNLQVQANVSGIDPNRTDVVTVPATVQLRPDLTVAAIQSPSQANLGAVVAIDAVVREANGESGARANCVLKADGVVVDHADGIWVDAGDAVTVEFRTTFATLGHKQLTVELSGITPGDYDSSNDSASTAIDIISPAFPVNYVMGASDMNYDEVLTYQRHEEFTSNSNYQNWVRDTTGGGTQNEHIVFYGGSLQFDRALTFPATFESRLDVDGAPLMASSFTVDENPSSYLAFSGPGYWNHCGDYENGFQSTFVCHYHAEFDGGVYDSTTAASNGRAGTVSYASFGTATMRYDFGAVDVYTFNTAGQSSDGETLAPLPASLGNHVDLHLAFTDAASQHYEATDSVQLYPAPTTTLDQGENCSTYDFTFPNYGRIIGGYCEHPIWTAHGTSGTTYGQVIY